MYENYPLLGCVFSANCDTDVILSPQSTKKIYELGIESIPSESECYPAKLVHGHVSWLIRQGVKFIFYPCIPYERNESPEAGNHYNCPMVTSYAENIKNNVEALKEEQVRFMNPFMAFTNEKILTEALVKEFSSSFQIPAAEIRDGSPWGLAGINRLQRRYQEKGRRNPEMDEGTRQTRHCAGRTSLPCGSGNPSRNPGCDHLLRLCGTHRRFCFPSWKGRAAFSGNRPVDVPLPASMLQPAS